MSPMDGNAGRLPGLNIEIKAVIDDAGPLRDRLVSLGAVLHGRDHQVDTYFVVGHGRLKVRDGTVESCIVYYEREDTGGPKGCRYSIRHFKPGDGVARELAGVLGAALGVLCVVDKRREIFFLDNLKFHLDEVAGFGRFFEIEAIGGGDRDEASLHAQCDEWLALLGIPRESLVEGSYSDMVLSSRGRKTVDRGSDSPCV